jgi:hypothetical protein
MRVFRILALLNDQRCCDPQRQIDGRLRLRAVRYGIHGFHDLGSDWAPQWARKEIRYSTQTPVALHFGRLIESAVYAAAWCARDACPLAAGTVAETGRTCMSMSQPPPSAL